MGTSARRKRNAPTPALLAALLLLTSLVVSADELRLKDGSLIRGTLVGLENGQFKVLTSWGTAFVRKEAVAAIAVGEDAATKPMPSPEPSRSAILPAITLPAVKPEPPKRPPLAPLTSAKLIAPAKPRVDLPALPSPRALPARALPVADPTADSLPAPQIIERVEGTTYKNETFQFELYKPPSWRVLEGAPRVWPAAIAALGKSDESALLVIARTSLHGSVASEAAAAEKSLLDTYANYLKLQETATALAGAKGILRRFQGNVDDALWKGEAVYLARDGILYTIMGVSRSLDPNEFDQAIVTRVIRSFRFLP
ncbi:MAG TPA: hypothetical protein VIH17_07335 [Candidatus Acidoferrales bacterium]